MLAAFDEGVARLSRVVESAVACERGWHERVQAALVALLEFMDEQLCWARFLILESPVAPIAICERRQRALSMLAHALERESETHGKVAGPREAAPLSATSCLTAEMVVGGAVAVIQARLLEGSTQPLIELAPSLMSFIAGPYRAAEREAPAPVRRHLPVRATYRTTCVLRAIGARPRSNNREIADAAGLRDEGQTSKLLSRLEQRGLVRNVGLGAAYGEPNAWLLTDSGESVLAATRRRSGAEAARLSDHAVGGAA